MTSEENDRKIELCHASKEYKSFFEDWKMHPYRTYLMEWDFDVSIEYWDEKEDGGMYADWDGDKVVIEPETTEEEEHLIVLDGLSTWKNKAYSAVYNMFEGFDWNQWNKEGMELARRLCSLLPEEYTVYYQRPFEDYEHLDQPPILIGKGKARL